MPKGKYKDPNKKGWHNQYGPCNRYEDVIDELCRYIEEGANYDDACVLAGIHRDQFYVWLRDEKKKVPIEIAKAKAKHAHLQRIRLGDRTWQSSAWYLERRYREEYALQHQAPARQKVEVTFLPDESTEPKDPSGGEDVK